MLRFPCALFCNAAMTEVCGSLLLVALFVIVFLQFSRIDSNFLSKVHSTSCNTGNNICPLGQCNLYKGVQLMLGATRQPLASLLFCKSL